MAKAAKKTPEKPESKAAAPAKGAKAAPPAGADPALDALAQGLAALQAKNWAKAVERFEEAVRESDRPEVRDRARQYLMASRQKAGGEKPAKDAEADPYLLAVYEKNRGNLKEALEISRKGGRDQKDERPRSEGDWHSVKSVKHDGPHCHDIKRSAGLQACPRRRT